MASLPKHLEDALVKLKPEDFENMIQETIKTIHVLRSKIDSKNPDDAKSAIDSVLDLKISLEEQMAGLVEGLGVDAKEFKEFMLNPDNYSEKEKEIMKQIDEKLVDLHIPQPPKEPKKGKRSKAAWIPG